MKEIREHAIVLTALSILNLFLTLKLYISNISCFILVIRSIEFLKIRKQSIFYTQQ